MCQQIKMKSWETFWNKYWNFIVSCVVFISTVILLYFRYDSISMQSIRDASNAFLITLLISNTFRLSTLQLAIEGSQDIIGKFIQLLSRNPSLKNTIEHLFEANKNENEFYKFFIAEVSENYNKNLSSLSQGKYTCDANAELSLTKTILKCCNKSLKAISFEDESWWLSYNGILYLEDHKKHINRKSETATRIFLIPSTSFESLKPIFLKHKELKIETYILFTDLDNIDKSFEVDFVIYDNYMVRRAYDVQNRQGGKEAVFTFDPIEVKKYVALFERILTLAKHKANPL